MMNAYVYLLRPVTQGILDHMNTEQEAVMDQHFTRLQGLFQMGGWFLLALGKAKRSGSLSSGSNRWTTRSGS